MHYSQSSLSRMSFSANGKVKVIHLLVFAGIHHLIFIIQKSFARLILGSPHHSCSVSSKINWLYSPHSYVVRLKYPTVPKGSRGITN